MKNLKCNNEYAEYDSFTPASKIALSGVNKGNVVQKGKTIRDILKDKNLKK